jgi:hypothetical protein
MSAIASRLREDRFLVRGEVDHAVGDDAVATSLVKRQILDPPLSELDP